MRYVVRAPERAFLSGGHGAVSIVLATSAGGASSTVEFGARANVPLDILWWVAPVSIGAVVAMVLLEAAIRLPPEHRLRKIADRAKNPLVAAVLGLIVLGGWLLSPVIVSVVAVASMILFEVAKSLPPDHRYRMTADRITAPLVAMAFLVVVLCGWQVAEIIGFVG